MSKKVSLADKYAQYKGNYTRPERPKEAVLPRKHTFSPYSYDLSSRFRDSRLQDRLRDKLPGLFGSPIKTIYSSPSRTKRPLSIYKVLPYLARESWNETSRVNKRTWLDRDQQSKKEGILGRLRGFLSRLHSESNTSEFQRLSQSAKDVLKIPPEEKSTVSLDELLAPRQNRTSEIFRDYDEVDSSVQLARQKLEDAQNREKKDNVDVLVQQQRQEITQLKEQYERQIYLAKLDHEAHIHKLNDEIDRLSDSVSVKHDTERERLEELQNSVLRDNESFLVYQRETERMFEDMKRRLEQREQMLNEREERLDERDRKAADEAKLKEETSKRAKTEYTKENARKQRLALDSNDTGPGNLDSYLANAKSEIAKMSQENDLRSIDFFDTMQKISQEIVSNGAFSGSQGEVLQKMEELVNAFDGKQQPPPDAYGLKLAEYDAYFDGFVRIASRNTDEARQVYSQQKLSGIEQSFKKLQRSLEQRMAKRSIQITDLQKRLARSIVSELNYSVDSIEQTAQGIKKLEELVSFQKRTVSTLEHLALLFTKLQEVQRKV